MTDEDRRRDAELAAKVAAQPALLREMAAADAAGEKEQGEGG